MGWYSHRWKGYKSETDIHWQNPADLLSFLFDPSATPFVSRARLRSLIVACVAECDAEKMVRRFLNFDGPAETFQI